MTPAAEKAQGLQGLERKNFPMARISTWGVGGAAKLLFSPADADGLLAFMSGKKRGEVLFVGHGSNLLVRDGGIDGVVVRTAPGLSQMNDVGGGEVYAEAGVACPKFARFCARAHLTGAEFFVGVPGTIGGALAMNAGCYGYETWDAVSKVRALINDGEDGGGFVELPREAFDIGYRSCSYARGQSGITFIGAWFKFAEDKEGRAPATMKEMLQKRAASQPLGAASAGSVFRNPPGGYAGKLIAECGLAKMHIGGAQVSDKHCNFIINRGDASAADIEELICKVREEVRAKTGVELQPEVRIVGSRLSGGEGV
ncbi:MAG: UDP-N-acetylmuramate dehydrogenase [Gammaproteobacteria bacterium]